MLDIGCNYGAGKVVRHSYCQSQDIYLIIFRRKPTIVMSKVKNYF